MEEFEVKDGVLLKYWGNAEKVIIPESVKTIGEVAFSNCESLEEITLPHTVEIGKWAFDGCDRLVVHYEGTEGQWKSSTSGDETPEYVKVICEWK